MSVSGRVVYAKSKLLGDILLPLFEGNIFIRACCLHSLLPGWDGKSNASCVDLESHNRKLLGNYEEIRGNPQVLKLYKIKTNDEPICHRKSLAVARQVSKDQCGTRLVWDKDGRETEIPCPLIDVYVQFHVPLFKVPVVFSHRKALSDATAYVLLESNEAVLRTCLTSYYIAWIWLVCN